MLVLSNVFSDKALFLHSAPLTVSGGCGSGAVVTLTLCRDRDDEVAVYTARETSNGKFSITFNTPPASFDTYTLTVSDGEDCRVMREVLFGELWLATGQSNMELSNKTHQECESIIDLMAERAVRAYYIPLKGPTEPHPLEPLCVYDGAWAGGNDREIARQISALGTSFAIELFNWLNRDGSQIPVGFINAGRGGSPLDIFLSREMCEDEGVRAYAERYRLFERFDGISSPCNHQTPTSGYNYIIHPLLGMSLRGIIWYQGETNSAAELEYPHYRHQLEHLRACYEKLFSPDPCCDFPMITCQLAPWSYVGSGGCQIGGVNLALAEAARRAPRLLPTVATGNLPLRWDSDENMHPIHPTTKYLLGKELARVAENLCYGRRLSAGQAVPPTASGYRRDGSRILVDFDSVGTGLRVEGCRPIGLYIRSQNGAFTPAECEVISPSTLAVYHPDIDEPAFVAYGISDFEFATNLYAGEFAVIPFTNQPLSADEMPSIQTKPWLNFEIDSVYRIDDFDDLHQECFCEPTVYPLNGCSLCFDGTMGGCRMLRVRGPFDGKGFYIEGHQFTELDFENYDALTLSLGHTRDLSAVALTLFYTDGTEVRLTAEPTITDTLARGKYRFDLTSLPACRPTRAEFCFIHSVDGAHTHHILIESIGLTPSALSCERSIAVRGLEGGFTTFGG